MRTFFMVTLTAMDHPHVEVEADEETGEPWAVVHLSEGVSIQGDLVTVRRWVDELQLKVATS